MASLRGYFGSLARSLLPHARARARAQAVRGLCQQKSGADPFYYERTHWGLTGPTAPFEPLQPRKPLPR
jgi:hypothetical protein